MASRASTGQTRPAAPRAATGRWIPITLLMVVAASGVSALVYEVAWMRMLAAILGSTSSAAAAVLAAFMGGLAGGSFVFGRVADRAVRPLVVFAALEAAIAVTALALPFAFDAAVPLYRWLYAASGEQGPTLAVARFIVSSLLLLVPTFMMGGTLPVIVRAVVAPADAGRGIGRLYALNTIGATLGALAAGFYLIPLVGLRMTVVFGAALNLANAAATWAMWRSGGAPGAPASDTTVARPVRPRDASAPVMLAVLLATALSGFVALASEVAWTRVLVFALGSTTYAFAAMLATYLAGLAAGAFLGTRIARRVPAVRALAGVQALSGVAMIASLLIYTRIGERVAQTLFAATDASWSRGTLLAFGAAALALAPAAVVMGAAFPLACAAYARSQLRLGSATGRVYATNTIGAVAGSLAAAFVLIPLVGAERTLVLLASVNVCGAAVLAIAHRPDRVGTTWAAGFVIAALSFLAVPVSSPLHAVGPTERLLFYKEGRTSTVSVVEDAGGMRRLYIDKIAVAGTDPVLLTDQKSLAHVPMLLRPHATRALTVGFGSGGASWSFTRYSRLQRVDCVEIDPTVLEAAPFLVASHHGVLAEPRFRVILEDAHSYLAATRNTYDIISTDCTDLRYKSNALLYTREYFALCRRRLNPGGLVAVWLPLGGLSTDDLRVALATFRAVFPNASLWYMNNVPAHYALLIGTDDPVPFDAASVAAQLREPAVHDDLAEIALADRWKLFGSFMTDGEGTRRIAGDARVNTEDRPILEFTVPRSAFRGSIARNLLALVQERRPPALVAATASEREQAARYWRGADQLVRGHAAFLGGTHAYQAAIARYQAASVLNPGDADIPRLIARVKATARASRADLEVRVAAAPVNGRLRNELGLVRLSEGDVTRAVAEFERAVALDPEDWEPWFNLGLARQSEGALDRAAAAYREAIARNPDAPGPHTNLGLLLLDRRNAVSALEELRRAADLQPGNADAAYNVGVAHQQLGHDADAAAAYTEAIRRQPTHAPALTNLAVVSMARGRVADALDGLDRALAADPAYAEAHYNRGLALEGAGRLADARLEYEQALRFRPGYPEAHNNLGLLLEAAGDRAGAIAEYREALAVRPAYAEAHTNLALALVAAGQPVEARAEAERAISVDPGMAQAYVSLGLACARMGDRAAAVQAFERALALDPRLPGLPALLAKARGGR